MTNINTPNYRVISRNNDRMFRVKLPSVGEYILKFPSPYFQKSFTEDEFNCGLRIFSDTENLTIRPSLILYDAEKEVITEIPPSLLYDCRKGSNYEDSIVNSTQMTCDKDTRFVLMNESKLYQGDYFRVKLKDGGDYPIKNQPVTISVHGVTYNKVTDENGIARLEINLNKDIYDFTCNYDGDDYHNACTNVFEDIEIFTVNTTALSIINPLSDNKYEVLKGSVIKSKLLDGDGRPMYNATVRFVVVNIKKSTTYYRKTDKNGIARMNINLNAGDYTFSAFYDGDSNFYASNEIKNVTMHVIADSGITFLPLGYNSETDKVNVVKGGRMQFKVISTDYSDYGLSYQPFNITIQGRTYKIKTDNNGRAYLNINLVPGDYSFELNYAPESNEVPVIFDNVNVNYNLTVQSTVSTKVTPAGIKWYDDSIDIMGDVTVVKGSYLYVQLTDAYGDFVDEEDVLITIHNVTYTKKTDSYGWAKLQINLVPGEYEYEAKYLGNGDIYTNSNIVSGVVNCIRSSNYSTNIDDYDTVSDFRGHVFLPSSYELNGNLVDLNAITEYCEFVFRVTNPTENSIVYLNNFIVNKGAYMPYVGSVNDEYDIDFKNTYYTNLYPKANEDVGVEIIRPYRMPITNKKIGKANDTLISPFYNPDIKEDRQAQVCKQALNSHEQKTRLADSE